MCGGCNRSMYVFGWSFVNFPALVGLFPCMKFNPHESIGNHGVGRAFALHCRVPKRRWCIRKLEKQYSCVGSAEHSPGRGRVFEVSGCHFSTSPSNGSTTGVLLFDLLCMILILLACGYFSSHRRWHSCGWLRSFLFYFWFLRLQPSTGFHSLSSVMKEEKKIRGIMLV